MSHINKCISYSPDTPSLRLTPFNLTSSSKVSVRDVITPTSHWNALLLRDITIKSFQTERM